MGLQSRPRLPPARGPLGSRDPSRRRFAGPGPVVGGGRYDGVARPLGCVAILAARARRAGSPSVAGPLPTMTKKCKGREQASSAKRKAKVAHTTSASSSALATAKGDGDRPAGTSKRRLGRRDTEDAVERLVMLRLGKTVPKEILEGRRNSKGQSIRDYIAEEIRSKRKVSGRLASRFWATLHTEFQLTSSAADLLEDDTMDVDKDSMNSELLDRLALLHHENPAARKLDPFLSFIGVAPELTYTELVLILRAIQEGAVILRKAATRLHMGVLAYIHRTAWERHPK